MRFWEMKKAFEKQDKAIKYDKKDHIVQNKSDVPLSVTKGLQTMMITENQRKEMNVVLPKKEEEDKEKE